MEGINLGTGTGRDQRSMDQRVARVQRGRVRAFFSFVFFTLLSCPFLFLATTALLVVGTVSGDFAAGAVLVSLPVMILFCALQKHFVEGLTAGGVKG